jgi:WD40 repeat protein/tRNA A-37 threonylcarbamoyl transferase component Bud32
MFNQPNAHPDPAVLAAFDCGSLPPDKQAAIEAHVAGCAECCARLDVLPDDPLVALIRIPQPRPSGSADTRSMSQDAGHTPSYPILPASLDVPPELAEHPRYRVLGLLGSGGMGTVFKAEHQRMERLVALKVIRKELTAHAEAVERFHLEAKAAARLTHPNIVTAYDADQAGDVHFLVMEYVEGETLESLVQRCGPLRVAEACSYIRQAALGLQHAYERGMVHRDIKPANLLLSRAQSTQSADIGAIKIADFGLARLASEQPAGTLTPAGTVVGTPDYIAPEQALQPQHADIRADIYSLGCTLYHLLAGRSPFPEGTALQKLMAHQQQRPPSLRALRGDVPAELVRVVERMMAKEPARRYQTPGDVAETLIPFAAATDQRRSRPARRRWRAILGAALAVAASGIVAWSVLRETPRTDDGNVRRIGGETGPFSAVAFNRDCTLALAAGPDHVLQLWNLDTGEVIARLEGHTDTVQCVAFSGDGVSAVSGGGDRTVIVWNIEQRRPLGKLAWHWGPIASVVYTHDPRHVLAADADGNVALWEIGQPEPKRVFHDDAGGVSCMSLDRYGGRLIVAGTAPTFRQWEYENRRWQLTKRIPGPDTATACLAWSYNARFLISGGADGMVRLWRAGTGNQLSTFAGHVAEVRSVALTRNELLALSGDAAGAVRLWDVPSGEELARYADHADAVLAVRFSYEGRHMASASADGTFIVRDVPVWRDGMPSGFLAPAAAVALSADGRLLAASQDAETVTLNEVIEGNGKPTMREITSVAADTHAVFSVALTPDGKLLATGGWDRIGKLWDVPIVDGRRTCTLRARMEGHAGAIRGVSLTADGKMLASSSDDGTVKLWDIPPSGGRGPYSPRATLAKHSGAVQALAFSTDGRTLLSAGADGTIRVWDVTTAAQLRVLEGHRGEVMCVALSPDGQIAASGGIDHSVRLWNLAEGTQRAVLPGHFAAITALAFDANGQTLASASEDRTVKLWNLAAAKERDHFELPMRPIVSVAIGRDGQLLAGVSSAGELELWNVP